jgi:predicted small metal-binding protein
MITKKLRCREIGFNCAFDAEGSTSDETVRRMDEHVVEVHHSHSSAVRKFGWFAAMRNAGQPRKIQLAKGN